MKWSDLLNLSFTNLARRKLRTTLTVLGVLIGTASIICMLSLSYAQSEEITRIIAGNDSLTTLILHSPNGGMNSGGQGFKMSDLKDESKLILTEERIKDLVNYPGVKVASPMLNLSVIVQKGKYQNYVSLQAMSKEALKEQNYHILEGEDFNFEQGGFQFLAGKDVAELYNYDSRSAETQGEHVDLLRDNYSVIYDPDNANLDDKTNLSDEGDSKRVEAKKYHDKPIGIIGPKDEEDAGYSSYMNIYAELEQTKRKLKKVFQNRPWPGQPKTKSGKALPVIIYNSALIRTSSLDASKELTKTFREVGYEVDSQIDFIDTVNNSMRSQQMFFGLIGGISLLVAAIGIANTMMMSIYERTKEIGVFKVLGCRLRSIGNIFMCEAAMIGFIGGLGGLFLSHILAFAINQFVAGSGALASIGFSGSKVMLIPLWLNPIALLFATIIGTVAGILPARRAMRLSALEAIRTN